MVENLALALYLHRGRTIHYIGHNLHSLAIHLGIGCGYGLYALLLGGLASHPAYRTCKACKTTATLYSAAQVRQLDVAMRIDKACGQSTRVKLGVGHTVEPIPLLNGHHSALGIDAHHRPFHHLPLV